MTLTEIVRNGAALVKGVVIEVDELHDTVAIGDYAFLQGDEAVSFIESARDLYEQCGDVGIDECYAYLAEQYCID